MFKKFSVFFIILSLLSFVNIDKVNADEEKLLSELILGEKNENVIMTAPSFSENSTDLGLYVQQNDSNKSLEGKPTYYYKGNVTNNYVKFGNILWRIVRINEDGSIKLITENIMFDSSFNTNYISGKVEYVNAKDDEADTIKDKVEDWYNSNIKINNELDSKVVTSIFCNDISSGNSFPYAPADRLYENAKPIFTCPNNAIKAYEKVGMITGDEIVFSGGIVYKENINNPSYLSTDKTFWSLTPVDEYNIYELCNNSLITISELFRGETFYISGVRPVINLDSKVMATGTGTENDPYVITIKASEEKEPVESYLTIKLDSNSNKDKIDGIVKNDTKVYFEVEENNTFPGKVKINVTGKYENGSKVWLYKYNNDTNKIEYVKNEIEVKNGEVIINFDNSGEYFLTLNEIDSSILSEQLGINLVFVIVFLSTILIGGTYVLIHTYKFQKNKI